MRAYFLCGLVTWAIAIEAATTGVAWVWTLSAGDTGAAVATGLEGSATTGFEGAGVATTTGLEGTATTSVFERVALAIDFATASLPKSGYILETIAFLIGAAATIGYPIFKLSIFLGADGFDEIIGWATYAAIITFWG